MQEVILTLAQTLTGAAEEERSLLERLCTAAVSDWEGRLRQGVTPSDCGEAFVCAAAFTAAAGLLTGRGGGEPVSSFTAGTVSVRGKSVAETSAAAEALRKQAGRLMTPFVKDAGFEFCGVRG